MSKQWRSVNAFAMLAVAGAVGVGCGDGPETSNGVELSGVTGRDKKIAAHLDAYIERNYGNRRQAVPPQENVPPRQRRAIAELSDNVAEVQRSIERISVTNTVITVETSLDSGEEGLQTARLICTVIYGADVADFTEGHMVVGPDSKLLAKCSPTTSPLK